MGEEEEDEKSVEDVEKELFRSISLGHYEHSKMKQQRRKQRDNRYCIKRMEISGLSKRRGSTSLKHSKIQYQEISQSSILPGSNEVNDGQLGSHTNRTSGC